MNTIKLHQVTSSYIKLHQVTSSYQKEPQTPQNKQKNLRNFGHNIVRSITLRKLQEHGITQFLTTRRFLLHADIEVLWVSVFLNACLFVLALVWSKDASNLIRMISWYMGPILYPEPKKHSSVIPNPKLDHSLRLRGCDQNGTPALLPRVFPNSRFVQNFTTAVNIRFRNSRGWTVQFLQHICRNNNTLWVWWIGKSKICNWFNPCEMDTYVIHGCPVSIFARTLIVKYCRLEIDLGWPIPLESKNRPRCLSFDLMRTN